MIDTERKLTEEDTSPLDSLEMSQDFQVKLKQVENDLASVKTGEDLVDFLELSDAELSTVAENRGISKKKIKQTFKQKLPDRYRKMASYYFVMFMLGINVILCGMFGSINDDCTPAENARRAVIGIAIANMIAASGIAIVTKLQDSYEEQNSNQATD